jgi:protoheme IX farnesyltransferase
MVRTKFAKFSWAFLTYNICVIIWGAFVRATISGDGCANDWPLCGGAAIPVFHQAKTIIEFVHRTSIVLIVPLLIIQVIWAFRAFPRGSGIRKSSLVSACFLVIEALIGAILVKKNLVGYDASVNRAVVMCSHLISTFILLASLTCTAAWASSMKPGTFKGQGPVAWALIVGLVGVLILGVSGAIAALGDTLFHAETMAQALKMDFSPTASFLTKLRPYHPLIAISVGIYTVLIGGLLTHLRPTEQVRRYAKLVTAIFVTQLALGTLNLLLLAPIWMQLIHLLAADVLWVAMILLTMSALEEGVEKVEIVERPVGANLLVPQTFRQTVNEYISLTKPRVISLLLFTTLTAMFAATTHWPGTWLIIAVSLGGYMSAGAANTINMVIDRDIDATMKRTSKRPTVTQNISSRNALIFGFSLEAGSFAILWGAANLLTAMLALAGLAFYVVVYTLVLKRRTWQNIVIGGAAGAFPPLVGWASVTNHLSPFAWFLFALIFVWTPVHFWALALMIKDDYAKAGVPMLPVVHGERATVIQIMLYAVLTAVISLLPLISNIGLVYVFSAIALNGVLIARCLRLYLHTERPNAVSLYKYSMVYLALLFLAFAIDRVHLA